MQAHGEIKLDWLGPVLRLQARGLFNGEGTLAGITEYQSAVRQAAHQRWARLDIWHPETLGTPDVFAHAAKAYRWSLEQGCCAIAIIAGNQMQKELVSGLLPAPFAFFENEIDALAWLQQYLAVPSVCGLPADAVAG